jgi:uncharacterized membrane protein (UPF0127 family)
MGFRKFPLVCILLAWCATAAFSQTQTEPLPSLELAAGMHRIEAEVAANLKDRMSGLMQRKTMATQKGMLFVFPNAARHCMWMRNTHLPLSVAFLDERGRIVNIEDMQPETDASHCASMPARYALEMNLGWFRERGIAPGFALTGIDKAPIGR